MLPWSARRLYDGNALTGDLLEVGIVRRMHGRRPEPLKGSVPGRLHWGVPTDVEMLWP